MSATPPPDPASALAVLTAVAARLDAAVRLEPTTDDPLLAGFAAMRGDLHLRPERADYPQLSRAWQEAFRDVVFDGVEPAAALGRAARSMESGS